MHRFLMLLGRGLYRMGLAKWIIQLQRTRIRGVLYHAIDNDDTSYNRDLKLSVSPDTLDLQLAYFSQHYRFVSYTSVEESPLSASLAISFDDGFSSVHRHAWPVLLKYNASASVFLVTTAVQQQLIWFNALNWALHEHAAEARKILARHLSVPLPDSPRDCIIEVQEHSPPEIIEELLAELYEILPFDRAHAHYLTPAQIDQMRAGGITFGFHTANHYNLINCDAEELARQLDSSTIGSLLTDCSFAYPHGYYDAKVLDSVVSRGFDPVMGVGVDNGRYHQRHLDRVEIVHHDAPSIFAQLEVAEPLLAMFRRWTRRKTGRRPSSVNGS